MDSGAGNSRNFVQVLIFMPDHGNLLWDITLAEFLRRKRGLGFGALKIKIIKYRQTGRPEGS
jgi:hypothetical protein